MEALIADGRVHRGMLGVTIQQVTPDIAKSLGLKTATGALVSSVQEDGPADDAGLERGDVITAIDGKLVEGGNELRNRIAATKPGARVTLTVIRDGAQKMLTATLKELPAPATGNGQSEGEPDGNDTALGLRVAPLPSDRARSLGLKEGEGLIVLSVQPNSPASDTGIRRGDVIEQVNGDAVNGVSDLKDAVSPAGARPALVLVRRGDQPIYLTLSPRSE